MNRIQSGDSACETTRRHFDSYISNELPAETGGDVTRHIGACPVCRAELDARIQLRASVKAAVRSQNVPPELRAQIREQIRSPRSSGWFGAIGIGPAWPQWAGAMAAVLLIGAVVWFTNSPQKMPALSDRPGQTAYIQKVSSTLSAVLKVGLGDHIHCSIFRKYPQNPPTVDQMEEKLGPSYKGLLPVVRAAAPEGYRVILAHQCSFSGRKFIHLTLEKDGDLLSLVIAHRQDGESLAGLSPTSQSSGVSIYQGSADRYQVAGFAAGEYLAFVVSDLNKTANLQIASNLAPAVRDILVKTTA